MRVRSRTAAALLVALTTLVVVGAAGAAVGQSDGQATVLTVEDTANQLSPPNVESDGHAAVGLDVGTAVAADAQRLAGLHDRLTLDERVADADDPIQRATIREAVDDAESRIVTLESERDRLLAAHADGELSTPGLTSDLLRLDAAADRERALLAQLETLADELRGEFPSVDAKLTALETANPMLEQPALDRIETTARGNASSQVAYVQTAPDGLVVATVGEEYVRQASLGSERNRTATNQFIDGDGLSWSAAVSRAEEVYPWAVKSDPISDSRFNIRVEDRPGDVHKTDVAHQHGLVEAFFDGGTTNVFREHQVGPPDAPPVTAVENATEDGVELEIAVTHATAPARVTVTDDGQPVAGASVTIAGRQVGQTDAGGELWVVQPAGPFEVGATTPDGRTISVIGS